jgi:hypothetical protein
MAVSGSVLIIKREETNRLGVGCSVFHEKASRRKMKFISSL